MTDEFNKDDFNPDVNYEDQEAIDHAKRMMKAAKYLHEKETQKHNDQLLNQLWNETLKEEGLDPQAYYPLAGADPEHTKRKIKEGMRTIISGVKKGRDSQGRFTSQPGQPARKDTAAPNKRLEALREKAHKQGGLRDDSDISDFIGEYIGSLLD